MLCELHEMQCLSKRRNFNIRVDCIYIHDCVVEGYMNEHPWTPYLFLQMSHHHVFCLTTAHSLIQSVFSRHCDLVFRLFFEFHYPFILLRSSYSCLYLFPSLPISSIVSSITCLESRFYTMYDQSS